MISSIEIFFLVFTRLAAILLTMPLFSGGSLPVVARGGLVLVLSLALAPLLQGVDYQFNGTFDYFAALFCELMLGLAISLLIRLIITVAELAGEMVALPLGLSLSQFFNPETNQQSMLSSRLMQLLAYLLLVSNEMFFRFVFRILYQGFIAVPQASRIFSNSESILQLFLSSVTMMFEQALLLALPLLLILMLVFVTMGLASRMIPQINLLILGLPLQLLIGMLILVLLLIPISEQLGQLFSRSFDALPLQLQQSMQAVADK